MTRPGRAIFITGTGTGVGKTAVACLLCEDARRYCLGGRPPGEQWREARRSGWSVGVMKPFASGGWEDTRLLRQASQTEVGLKEITPVFFKTPASPWAAALKEKTTVDLKKLDQDFLLLCRRHDIVLVEGIGGVLVPITEDFTVADLIARWRLPAVLVASWELGTLNHTLLSLEALARRKIPVAGLIFNQTQSGKTGFVHRTNLEYFRKRKYPPVLATVAHHGIAGKRCLSWEPQGRERLWGRRREGVAAVYTGKTKSSLLKIEK